jgi:hypothetical protein
MNEGHAPECDEHARGTSGERDDQRLRYEQVEDHSARGAQGQANRELPLAIDHLGEHEVDHVCRGQTEDQQRGDLHHQKQPLGELVLLSPKLQQIESAVAVRLRISRGQPRRHLTHVFARGAERHARLQSGDGEEMLRRVILPLRGRQHEGHPGVEARRVTGVIGNHTDEGHRPAVQGDRSPDQRGVGTESRLPVAVTEHDAVVLPGFVLAGSQGSARDGSYAQRFEEGRRNGGALNPLGFSASRQQKRHRMERGDSREDAVVAAKLHEVARRNGIALVRALGQPVIPHDHQVPELGVRIRREQERVQHAERGGVEPKPRGQDEERTSRESRPLGETPSDETHVASHEISVLRRCGFRPSARLDAAPQDKDARVQGRIATSGRPRQSRCAQAGRSGWHLVLETRPESPRRR